MKSRQRLKTLPSRSQYGTVSDREMDERDGGNTRAEEFFTIPTEAQVMRIPQGSKEMLPLVKCDDGFGADHSNSIIPANDQPETPSGSERPCGLYLREC